MSTEQTADAAHDRSVAEEVYDSFETISRYVDILASRGIEWGLIGPKESDRLWGRHILNCAAISGLVPEGARVADIGSGAGLPGLPLAILRPDLEVVLIESLLRRVNFLELAVEELDLTDRVTVVRGRAEEWKGHADVVTCRAVKPLPQLLTWTSRIFLPEGQLVALKGSSAADEVAQAAPQLKRDRLVAEVRSVRCHPSAEPTNAIVVRRG